MRQDQDLVVWQSLESRLLCMIVERSDGDGGRYLCGYVRIPESHPLYDATPLGASSMLDPFRDDLLTWKEPPPWLDSETLASMAAMVGESKSRACLSCLAFCFGITFAGQPPLNHDLVDGFWLGYADYSAMTEKQMRSDITSLAGLFAALALGQVSDAVCEHVTGEPN